MAEKLLKYNSRTREAIFTEICLLQMMKLLTQPSSSRPDSAVSAQPYDEEHEILVA